MTPDSTALREKLRLIRDSDHPASPWARNVVQCLDELKDRPDDPGLLRALGAAVVGFDRMMMEANRVDHILGGHTGTTPALTPDEIAAIFGLGEEPDIGEHT